MEEKDEEELTLNQKWLDENTDRLLAWELFRRGLMLDYSEIPSQKLCDMIGVPKNYVFNVIKRAQKVCKPKRPKH
jgi:hypothetical protein|tara:strand:+ start:500 stop:724 length:225 start_codon:yes stop_codon:yes gene_type:complete